VQNQYPACTKSTALAAMFSTAGLASVWSNYCLKATQIDFTSTQNATMGQPVIDGDSVIERVHGRRADRPILLHHLSRLRGRHGAGMRQREQQSGTGLTRTDWAGQLGISAKAEDL
jgi:hypothetical protein